VVASQSPPFDAYKISFGSKANAFNERLSGMPKNVDCNVTWPVIRSTIASRPLGPLPPKYRMLAELAEMPEPNVLVLDSATLVAAPVLLLTV